MGNMVEGMSLKFTEAQQSFVVSRLIAWEYDRQIAQEFLSLYPHFNNGRETEVVKQRIMDQCKKYVSDPQWCNIIKEGRQRREGDLNPILLTHRRYRDHLRQNILYQLEDLEARCQAGELDPKIAKALAQGALTRNTVLNDYEKSEARR